MAWHLQAVQWIYWSIDHVQDKLWMRRHRVWLHVGLGLRGALTVLSATVHDMRCIS